MRILMTIYALLITNLCFSQALDERYVQAMYHDLEGKIENNDMVRFRITEDLELKNVTIPKHTLFSTVAQFTGDRVRFVIEKIEVNQKIYAVNLRIVAADLKEGLPYNKKKDWIYMFSEEYKFLVQE